MRAKGICSSLAWPICPAPRIPTWVASLETYTDGEMLEVETLGPLVKLEPQATVEHVEDWYLLKDVPTPDNDTDVMAQIAHRIPLR